MNGFRDSRWIPFLVFCLVAVAAIYVHTSRWNMILVIPLMVSLPFLIWNAEGFVRSILFSATRYPDDHFDAPSLDAMFGFYGIPAKTPMLLLLSLTYALASLHRVPVYASLLLVMAAFFGFNSVLFRQYVVWFIPFIPLTALEARDEAPH